MFGKHDGTLEDVIQASEMADVHKNIEKFKAAYDTVLGERGLLYLDKNNGYLS